MKDIRSVYDAYVEADSFLSAKESASRTQVRRNRWADRRDRNDHAYFALLFAQFEDVVNTLCRQVVTKKKSSVNWGTRRAWDIVNTGDLDRVPFMNRVALLVEKGQTEFNLVNAYYRTRCEIDHGQTVSSISVVTAKSDLLRIASRMKRSA